MVCKRCGKELPEGTKFCVACGAACEETTANQTGETAANQAGGAAAGEQKAEGGSKAAVIDGVKAQFSGPEGMKKLIAVAAGVVILVLLIVFCNLIFGSSPKKAFKAFVQGTYSWDFKKIMNNSISAKKAQKALDTYDKDDFEDEYEDAMDYYKDLLEDMKDDGIKYKVSVDIKDVEKIKKSDKEFDWACEFMEDYYDCDSDKIKQFAIVEAKIKAEYYEDGDRDSDGDEKVDRTQYLLVKLGGDWYVTATPTMTSRII